MRDNREVYLSQLLCIIYRKSHNTLYIPENLCIYEKGKIIMKQWKISRKLSATRNILSLTAQALATRNHRERVYVRFPVSSHNQYASYKRLIGSDKIAGRFRI